MYSVGSGMVLATGDLAGANSRHAAPPTVGSLLTIEIEVAVTGAVIELRGALWACPIRYPSGRPENPRQSFRPSTERSQAGFLLAVIRKG